MVFFKFLIWKSFRVHPLMSIPAAPFRLSIIAPLCPIGCDSLWNWAIAWKRNYSGYSLWAMPCLALNLPIIIIIDRISIYWDIFYPLASKLTDWMEEWWDGWLATLSTLRVCIVDDFSNALNDTGTAAPAFSHPDPLFSLPHGSFVSSFHGGSSSTYTEVEFSNNILFKRFLTQGFVF